MSFRISCNNVAKENRELTLLFIFDKTGNRFDVLYKWKNESDYHKDTAKPNKAM